MPPPTGVIRYNAHAEQAEQLIERRQISIICTPMARPLAAQE